jgi:type IV secretory pathway VirB10-like protein
MTRLSWLAPPLVRHCAPLAPRLRHIFCHQPPSSKPCRAFTVRSRCERNPAPLGAPKRPEKPAALRLGTTAYATTLGIPPAAPRAQRAPDADARAARSLCAGAAKEAQEGKLQGAAAATAEGSQQGVAAEQQQQKQQSGSGQVRPSRRPPRSPALAARRSAPGVHPYAGP